MAVINKVELPSGTSYDVSTLSIPFGQVDDTSTSTVFTATIPGITELYDGVCVYLKNGVITSASGWTLNINNLGAKPVYQTQAAASRTTTIFNVAYTGLFVYNSSRVDGGCWDYFYGYNSDTNTTAYQVRANQTINEMHAALTRYKICFTMFDGTILPSTSVSNSTATTKALTTEAFDPYGAIYYYNTTTGVAAGESPGASYMWLLYPTVDMRYTFNTGTTLVAKDNVYIKCSPQADGSVKLAGNDCIVQSLPNTDDGYVYIYLGKAYDNYRISLDINHPVYYYKDGAIRLWTNTSIPDMSNYLSKTNTTSYTPTADYNPATKKYVDEVVSAAGAQSDWNEDDTTSSSYIQNRTHYKTSLGYDLHLNLFPYMVSSDELYQETFTVNSETISAYFISDFVFANSDIYDESYFPTNTIDDFDLSLSSSILVVDGVSQTLNHVISRNDSYFATDVLFAYNNEYVVAITNRLVAVYHNANSVPASSLTYDLKLSNEIFEYNTLDNRYLNGELIIKGYGEKSEIFNGITYDHDVPSKQAIGFQSHIEGADGNSQIGFYLSGKAGDVTYKVREFYYDYRLGEIIYGKEIFLNYGDEATGALIENFDVDILAGIGTITLSKTLDENNDMDSEYCKIYISSSVAIGIGSHVEGNSNIAVGSYSHAEGSNNLSYDNNSHSEGSHTKSIGTASHSEGSSTIANSNASHAEGTETIASGYGSHSEGNGTYTSGSYSHAEGQYYDNATIGITLSGNANATTYNVISDTNGLGLPRDYFIGAIYNNTKSRITSLTKSNGIITKIQVDHTLSDSAIENKQFYFSFGGVASGNASHVEGKGSVASGNTSHAEGWFTLASGDRSHSEGWGTLAYGTNQHVQGKYNIGDTSNTYAHIVGNGNSTTRSNAHTLDWSGNGWYAGKLTVGAAPTNDMDVATKKYVDDNAGGGGSSTLVDLTDTTISSPTNGQVLMYNSTTSKWENVTLSLAISGNIIQLKEGNTVISSVNFPIYNGGVSS